MRLLFDENLSPGLPALLADVFPDSAHVREVALKGADDYEIWACATAQGFMIVTKDDDFEGISVLRGAPPKLVMIGLGNCSTAEVASLLRHHAGELAKFAVDPVGSVIELPPPA